MQLTQAIKQYAATDRRILTLYAMMTVAYAVMFLYFAFVTGNRSHSLIVWSVIDGVILFSPLLILPPRWRWVMTVIFWILAVYMFINCLYAQFFSSVIKVRDYWLASTIDSLVLKSVLSNLGFADILFLLCPAAVTVFSRMPSVRKAAAPIGRRHLLWFISAVILMTGVRQTPYIIRNYPADDEIVGGMYDLKFNESLNECQWMGLAFYIPWSIVTTVIKGRGTIELTAAQRRHIYDFLLPAAGKDSTVVGNRGKNLIFIVVESLNSWQVNYSRDGFVLMPTLRSLMQEQGAVTSLSVFSQVGMGGSSDGQFIYNTGLLPLRDDIVATSFGWMNYPSMAKALEGYHSVEVIGEKAGIWNHAETTRAYGYDRLYCQPDIAEAGLDRDALGYDEVILRFSAGLSTRLPQPFFMFITTLSMHIPYDLINCSIPPAVASDSSLSDEDKRFAANTHYFDRCLRDFINALKRDGIYDNTVIVLAADHSYDTRYKFRVEETSEIAFAALNTGITRCITDSVGQVDIFPTVMDIMGVEPKFPGLGTSILRPGEKGIVGYKNETRGSMSPATEARLKEAWEISNLMIRGNYFGQDAGE